MPQGIPRAAPLGNPWLTSEGILRATLLRYTWSTGCSLHGEHSVLEVSIFLFGRVLILGRYPWIVGLKKKTNQNNRKFCTGKNKKTCTPSNKNYACTGEIASMVIFSDQDLGWCWTKLQKAIFPHALSFPYWHHFHDSSSHGTHDIGNHSQQHWTCWEIRYVKLH